MEEFFGKVYQLEKSENFDEYLKFIEMGFSHRSFARDASGVKCSLEKNADGSYKFTLSHYLKGSSRVTFVLGEEFVEDRVDRVKVISVMTIEGNKLIQTQTETNGRKSTHVREFTPETVVVTTTVDGWDGKCVRTYRIVQ